MQQQQQSHIRARFLKSRRKNRHIRIPRWLCFSFSQGPFESTRLLVSFPAWCCSAVFTRVVFRLLLSNPAVCLLVMLILWLTCLVVCLGVIFFSFQHKADLGFLMISVIFPHSSALPGCFYPCTSSHHCANKLFNRKA